MPSRKPPDPVDLRRYRQARDEAARRKAPPAPAKQPVLGARKGSGLILAVVVLVVLALWLGPQLL